MSVGAIVKTRGGYRCAKISDSGGVTILSACAKIRVCDGTEKAQLMNAAELERLLEMENPWVTEHVLPASLYQSTELQ